MCKALKVYSSIILFLLTIISCNKVNPQLQIKHINGYWEIEKVILSDGNVKEYGFNSIIDFFEIKDTTGIRKKIQPRFNEKYVISGKGEQFSVNLAKENIQLHYKTSLTSWKETIITLKENKMVIKNEAGNVYFYRRHQKIKL
ncbi:lipocalin family protein [Aquimarina sp. 2201CG1-2-11]|uniref:lipocalin family protein n=1 Tax=Aquimarina discodermiae TaxID=3231043 RepID=UPI0034618814